MNLSNKLRVLKGSFFLVPRDINLLDIVDSIYLELVNTNPKI